MPFLWKKQKEIEKSIEGYLEETEQCLSAFGDAFRTYFTDGLGPSFEELVKRAHAYESKCDDKRREIERSLYGRALIPEFRGDILGMLEALDKVPNKCESVLYQIVLENITIPDQYHDKTGKLIEINVESYRILCNAVRCLFTNNSEELLSAVSHVDQKESESDGIEHEIIKTIFSSDMDKADMILLRDLILEIGSISDRAENVADRLSIIAAKQQA